MERLGVEIQSCGRAIFFSILSKKLRLGMGLKTLRDALTHDWLLGNMRLENSAEMLYTFDF